MNELMIRCSGSFQPTRIEDFVGTAVHYDRLSKTTYTGARITAEHIQKSVELAKANGNAVLKFLFNGKPGVGKSALVAYCLHLLGANKWSTTKLNGTQVKVEKLEEIAAAMHYSNIFGDYRVLWIDEADEIPRVAQVRFLTLLDDLPPGTAVLCTSNCKLDDFENRFQTRFQAFNIQPPAAAEIEALLTRFIPEQEAKQISMFACGNVRAALLDAQGVAQQSYQPSAISSL